MAWHGAIVIFVYNSYSANVFFVILKLIELNFSSLKMPPKKSMTYKRIKTTNGKIPI